ncbi:MAG: alpha/beta hydrolase [Actinobacteria bacterium]|nr:alpha/beta hydrolase [Actinomycetota bacterium]
MADCEHERGDAVGQPAVTAAEVLTRNAVTVLGAENASVVVFGHGYGTEQSVWRGIAARLAQEHRVVLFDYVGSGRSDLAAYDEQRYDSLHGYAEDLIEVLDAVGASNVLFVGHSLSGMIGALAAIRRPEFFRKLLMVCPSPRYLNDGDYIGGFTRDDVTGLLDAIDANQLAWASSLAPVVTARPDRPEISERVREQFAATNPRIATHFARVTFLSDTRHRLGEIPVPCVVLQSRGDIIAPPHIGAYLRDHIPDCTLIELNASGHFVHLAEPELIETHIRAAL